MSEEDRLGITIINSIDSYCVNQWSDMDASDSIHLDELQPIPLTKEYIVKFGLDKKWFHRPLMFHQIHQAYNVICMGHLITRLEYVHQLQNFYFDVTGEELEIKK